MNDGDKDTPEPDPWADLEVGETDGLAKDLLGFDDIDFGASGDKDPSPADPGMEAVEPPATSFPDAFDTSPQAEAAEVAAQGDAEEVPFEIPLSVFPPSESPVVEAEGVGAEQEVDVVVEGLRIADSAATDEGDGAEPWGELDVATPAEAAGDEPQVLDFLRDEPGETAEEMPASAGLFEAGSEWQPDGAGAFPGEDAEAAKPVEGFSVTTEPSTIAGAVGVASVARPRKKGGGLGQVVGVVFGGLLALPVTYAILIWGFHKDPFKLGRQLPPQVAALLPQKLQPGFKAEKTGSAGSVRPKPSLDDLETDSMPVAVDTAASADPPTADDAPAEPAGDDAGAETKPVVAAIDADTTGAKERMTETALDRPEAPKTSGADTDDDGASPAPAATDLAVALPTIGGLPMLDGVGASPAPLPPAVAEPPPLDLTALEAAVDRAVDAFGAVRVARDEPEPARDRLLVAWYKRLARVGEELVRIETEAAESSQPLNEPPAAVAGLFEEIRGDEDALAEIERLGRMWLTKRGQGGDGVALVMTLDGSRRVGPYWVTRGFVAAGNADGSDRPVAIASRSEPPRDAGVRVIAAGVMFDDDTVWATGVWPVEHQVASRDEPPGAIPADPLDAFRTDPPRRGQRQRRPFDPEGLDPEPVAPETTRPGSPLSPAPVPPATERATPAEPTEPSRPASEPVKPGLPAADSDPFGDS